MEGGGGLEGPRLIKKGEGVKKRIIYYFLFGGKTLGGVFCFGGPLQLRGGTRDESGRGTKRER